MPMTFNRIPRRGYYVHYGKGVDTGKYKHYFCGRNDIAEAICPNCDKPLLKLLSLDTSDPRLELQDSPFAMLPLLYCWTCNISQGPPFCYQVQDDGLVRLISYGKGKAGDTFPYVPYNDYPVYFPGSPAGFSPVPSETDEAMEWHYVGDESDELEAKYGRIVEKVYGESARHQVGGVPFLVQGPTEEVCELCGRALPFFATIADDNLDARGFASGGVQTIFHYCRECHVAHVNCDTD
jgi:hypothetical protein